MMHSTTVKTHPKSRTFFTQNMMNTWAAILELISIVLLLIRTHKQAYLVHYAGA